MAPRIHRNLLFILCGCYCGLSFLCFGCFVIELMIELEYLEECTGTRNKTILDYEDLGSSFADNCFIRVSLPRNSG